MNPARKLALSILIALAPSILGCPQQGQDPLDMNLPESGQAPNGDPSGVGDPNVPTPTPEPCVNCGDAPCVNCEPVEPQPFGVWLLESGGMLSTMVQGASTAGVTTDVTALILNEDGTGRVFFRDRLTGMKDSVRVLAIYDDDAIALDFAAEPTIDFVYNLAITAKTFVFPFVVFDEDSLSIGDETGAIAIFSRQSSLPADATPSALTMVDRFDNLPAPNFFSDLALLGDDLLYTGRDQLEAFRLTTDAMTTSPGPTLSRHVQTVQDNHLWTHCGCGGSKDAYMRTLTSVADTINSESELGGAITMRAMAYEPMTDRLWIHGRDFANSTGRFYIVDTNAEPDTLERTIPFNRDVRGLAFDGTDMWAIATLAAQSIVRIDATTGETIETYETPDEGVSWAGIVFDGDFMYLLGTDLDGEGVILRVERP
ncbi:MAG TPA: hypothetical protein P5081_09680 [Phycisphaerae bacterium]|nr:hypothetical protein [Phycisphaerae bacterium]HRW53146.1 hypothetical protein [Phycisphaerae bacterium]